MPTYSCHIPEDETGPLDQAIKDAAPTKGGRWIREAIDQRLERDGYLPGTPAFDIRTEALSAAEIAGDDAVLQALRQVKASVFSAHASEERKVS